MPEAEGQKGSLEARADVADDWKTKTQAIVDDGGPVTLTGFFAHGWASELEGHEARSSSGCWQRSTSTQVWLTMVGRFSPETRAACRPGCS
jgi:hypothetical protein